MASPLSFSQSPICVQALLHDHRNAAVGGGADVQQQIAAAAHEIHQHEHQFAAGVVILEVLGAIVAVGEAHAAALFPRVVHAAHAGRVFGGAVAAVLVAGVLAPAIVDDDFVLDRRLVEQPRQQFRRCATRRRSGPTRRR